MGEKRARERGEKGVHTAGGIAWGRGNGKRER